MNYVPSVAKLWLHRDGLSWLGDGVLIRDGSGVTNAKFSLECSKKKLQTGRGNSDGGKDQSFKAA